MHGWHRLFHGLGPARPAHPRLWLDPAGRRGRHGGHGWMGDGHGMGGDGPGMMRGRKFGADELQLMLLALLEEQARHGYELIKELETRSNGYYSPSPGVIYPALTYLEELDYATVEAHGNRKRYHLAPAGRAHLDTQRERVELLFAGLQHAARKMAWMKQAWQGEAGVQEAVETSGWLREFVEARHALREALLRRSQSDAGEQRRIAAILRRAAAEILRGDKAC
ncbi:PadR family transcriptional regulator [Bordetella genomosp. 2]|uniref:PadR family transcriptional regulator n=1 Tax=Bordetella genomosp. 2 TaxID=1983456 RepID=A0A261VGV1_9BORD|nr:PadR family transcriptional regulator [Bordetella genomosp. 2]OZI72393.1 PadR family transcriptional regulator [Bordetella genomosp. 2]